MPRHHESSLSVDFQSFEVRGVDVVVLVDLIEMAGFIYSTTAPKFTKFIPKNFGVYLRFQPITRDSSVTGRDFSLQTD